MRCAKCGTELRDDARFCKACGSKVEKEKSMSEKADNSAGENRVNFQSMNIFKTIQEQIQQAEQKYLNVEKELIKVKKENSDMKQQILKKSDLLKQQEQKYQESQKLVKDLQNKLSDAEIRIERLNDQIVSNSVGLETGEPRKFVNLTCPKCNAPVDENTIFCGECGTKIR